MDVVHARELEPAGEPSSVTIGFFDGVHRGHQTVIRRAVEVAHERSLRPVAITFDRHPLQTLSPGKVPPLLTTLRRKADLIEALGVERLVVLEFTEEVSRWSAESFVERTLVRGLRANHVVVGTNFTFGHRAAGNFEMLSDLGERSGFTTSAVALFKVDGRPVSSSSIREALAEGDLTWPERALGRRYIVDGTVVPGAGRGRALGFRTANLRTPDGILLPGRGVYAGQAMALDRLWPAAVNIGVNPTFGPGTPLHVEAHLLDFDGDLLGTVMALEFWQRLRDEIPFDSPEELAKQIRADVERTRDIASTGAERAV